MPEPSSKHSHSLAFGLLILGKAFGIGGLVLGAVHRVGGASLLALDGLLIVVAIVMSLRAGRKHEKAAEGDKQTVARLMREGTLKQYLRDLEREARLEAPSKPPVEVEAAAE